MPEFLQRIDQPADMMIGVLQEAGVDFHLRAQDGFIASGMSSHAGISAWRAVSSQSSGMTPSFFCRAKVSSRSLSQPWSNLPLYLSAHSLGTWCGACVAPGAKYTKNGLSAASAFCWRDPGDRLVGHVRHEVVALFGRLLRLDRRRAFVERGIPLVGLAADEAVEVFEPAAAGRPCVERPDRARLPHRHLMALAELRGRVAVELQRPRQRRDRVRQHRTVARRGGRDLGDAAHAGGMMIAPGQQRLPRRRAERGRVEAGVLESVCRQPFGIRRLAGAAEGARRAEPDIVEQDDQTFGAPLGGRNCSIGGNLVSGSFAS